MSGSKNKEFLADPTAFLARNLVVVKVQQLAQIGQLPNGRPQVGPKFNEGAILTLDTRKTDSFYAQDANGDDIDACELVEATGDAKRVFGTSHHFPADYLPFLNNATRTIELRAPQGQTSPLYSDAAVHTV